MIRRHKRIIVHKLKIGLSKTASFANDIAPLIRLDGETYSCQLQLPGPKVQGSTAVAFVAEFLIRQKFLKLIRG
jgi:hypothetical protein